MVRLKNKVSIITGGGSGIGRETCKKFSNEGAIVAVIDCELNDAKKTVEMIKNEGNNSAIAIKADIVKEEDIKKMVAEVYNKFDCIDILVNNAAVRGYGRVTELKVDEWQKIFEVNLRGVALCCKHVIPIMQINTKGSIINVSSSNAIIGRRGSALYDSMKAGLLALTRSMACDHAEDGIRVNNLVPGPTLTGFHKKRARERGKELSEEKLTERHEGGPGILKRIAHPKEIANAMVFLASNESSYITGTTFCVDGGYTSLDSREKLSLISD